MMAQLELLVESAVRVGPVRPRPAAQGGGYVPEYVQIELGVWAVCVFILIPKNGFGHLHFPAYWGGPQDSPRWRVDRHGSGPHGLTFVFTSRAEAEQVVTETFGDPAAVYRYMSWIEIPSDDHRPKAAGRRAPRTISPSTP